MVLLDFQQSYTDPSTLPMVLFDPCHSDRETVVSSDPISLALVFPFVFNNLNDSPSTCKDLFAP